MKFTNAELMKRKREKKELRGVKELRGIYVKASSHDEVKILVKDYVSKIESDKNLTFTDE